MQSNLGEYARNPYVQGAALILALAIYILSPDNSIRLITGLILAVLMIGIVAMEIRNGAKEKGWKHELKETLLALAVALLLWFAAQFILNTSSPISAVVSCSMLPNLQRGDFAIVQGAPVSAYSLEISQSDFDALSGKSHFSAGGQDYDTYGSIYSYCISYRPEFCTDFVEHPENYPETRGPFTFHYSSCTMDIKNKGELTEPCVTSVSYGGQDYPVRLSNDIVVYQPAKEEYYALIGDIIHRSYFKLTVRETGQDFYLTKGDNNQVLDIQVYDYSLKRGNGPISQDRLKGKLLFKVPLLGYYKLVLSGLFTEPSQCSTLLSYPHS